MVLEANTQVGDRLDVSRNSWIFHIMEIHKMTLGFVLIFVVIFAIIIGTARWGHRRHVRQHLQRWRTRQEQQRRQEPPPPALHVECEIGSYKGS
jgi:hypothetical protein